MRVGRAPRGEERKQKEEENEEQQGLPARQRQRRGLIGAEVAKTCALAGVSDTAAATTAKVPLSLSLFLLYRTGGWI